MSAPNLNIFCKRCGEKGHEKRFCPQPKPFDEPVDDVCWTCGHRGHYTKHCHQPENPSNDSAAYNRFANCWNCRGSGHKRENCPNQQILFCSFCGKAGITTIACSCNSITRNNNKSKGSKKRSEPGSSNQNTEIHPEPEQTDPPKKEKVQPETPTKPELPPKEELNDPTDFINCSMIVTIGAVRFQASFDNTSAISRINSRAVDLEASGAEYDGDGWVGLKIRIGGHEFYLLFVIDDTLQGNVSFGTDAQLIMDFNVTIGGRSIHRPQVLPDILFQRETTSVAAIEESPRFEEIEEDQGAVGGDPQPSTSRQAMMASPGYYPNSAVARRLNPEETSDSDSSVPSSYGRYQRGRRN